MSKINLDPFILRSIELSAEASLHEEVPVGAVLVFKNEIIAEAYNHILSPVPNPTAHAEMIVIQQGAALLKSPRLVDCDLYVSLEPCPMCAQAISFARIRRLYFGAYDPKGGGVDHGPRIFQQTSCHHRPEVFGGLCEDKASLILKNFFEKKRK